MDFQEKINALGKKKIPFFFAIDFLGENTIVSPIEDLDAQNVLFNINHFKNYSEDKKSKIQELEFEKTPIPFTEYKKSYDIVQENLKAGNTYLLNLTFETPIKTNLPLSDIFHKSRAKYRLLMDDQFVVFSPECFVKIADGKISSYPMKGTIDASIPDAEKKIIDDKKEYAEHVTIVDLIRNDLGIVAEDVKVKRFRYIDKIKTNDKELLQVSSEIEGRINSQFTDKLGDLLFSLLPAGSISGAPKKKTVEIIKEAEQYERGFFTGIMGCFDGERLDSGVMIRFIENKDGELFYKSGGGITSDSDPVVEYQEMIDKIYLPF